MSTVANILTRAYGRHDAFIATVSADETNELVPLVDQKQKALFLRGAATQFFGKKAAVAAASNKWTMPTDSVGLPYRIEEADETEVNIVPVNDREAEFAPRVYIVGNEIFTVNAVGDPDETSDALTVFYNRSPTTLTATSDSLDSELHTGHEQILEVAVAITLARRARLLEELASFQAELVEAMAGFDQEIGLPPAEKSRYPTP